MCIAIPGKVVKVEEDGAVVSFGGTLRKANLDLMEEVQEGDYVIVHAGFAIRKLDEEEALETLEWIKEAGLEIR
ncbi:MAG: HypC/HybG/HupF family hydrogenase formation chaperone [candidate division NC10 bacterium]|nr:HypC/HybG/HupF family hydrogenase formation chaperone [candidate division NC10 bacterium]